MGRPRRYAALGALAGAIVGAAVAVLTAHARAASGAPPPFLLETVGLFVAPPFGLLLAYPLAALTGLGGAGVLVWTVLTPAANWALVGLLVGTVRDVRARNREVRQASRPAR
jgi:hypothetical protein